MLQKIAKCGSWAFPSQVSHYFWIEKLYGFVLIWFTWRLARRLLTSQDIYPFFLMLSFFLQFYQWDSILSSIFLPLLNTLIAAPAIHCDPIHLIFLLDRYFFMSWKSTFKTYSNKITKMKIKLAIYTAVFVSQISFNMFYFVKTFNATCLSYNNNVSIFRFLFAWIMKFAKSFIV